MFSRTTPTLYEYRHKSIVKHEMPSGIRWKSAIYRSGHFYGIPSPLRNVVIHEVFSSFLDYSPSDHSPDHFLDQQRQPQTKADQKVDQQVNPKDDKRAVKQKSLKNFNRSAMRTTLPHTELVSVHHSLRHLIVLGGSFKASGIGLFALVCSV